MDAELREYLESLRLEMLGRFNQVDDRFNQVDDRFNQVDDRFNQVDDRITKEVAALRDEIVVGYDTLHKEIRAVDQGLREEIRAVDQGLRVLVEDVRNEVRAVSDGVTMMNEKLDRRLENQKYEIDNRMVPMEAVVENYSGRIQDHERRITILESRGGR